jgi:hypothetical protein
VITVDEPSLSIVIGINDGPLAGREGSKLTARQIKDRLDRELVGNVSIRVRDTERSDAWEVHGRGELQLVVLLELMRREGFEIVASQPRVLTREVDGKLCEPVERLAIDAPEEYVGVVTQMLALRKGRMEQMINHSTGWVRLDYLAPARGLIGFRTEFLTETRGTGILPHVFEGWEPWAGELRTRPTATSARTCRSSVKRPWRYPISGNCCSERVGTTLKSIALTNFACRIPLRRTSPGRAAATMACCQKSACSISSPMTPCCTRCIPRAFARAASIGLAVRQPCQCNTIRTS